MCPEAAWNLWLQGIMRIVDGSGIRDQEQCPALANFRATEQNRAINLKRFANCRSLSVAAPAHSDCDVDHFSGFLLGCTLDTALYNEIGTNQWRH